MNTKINEMLKMQKAYDQSVYAAKDVHPTMEQKYLALIDEIGELTHELKPTWCWWKIHVGEVDRAKVLEELIDCWHFALSIWNEIVCTDFGALSDYDAYKKVGINMLIERIICYEYSNMIIDYIIALSLKLEFTIDEVFEEYKRKNKINFERLENGY